MRRRELLAGVGTLPFASMAGCIDVRRAEPDVQWPSHQHDERNTAAVTGTIPLDGPPVQWRVPTWGSMTEPVIARDTVYFGTGLRHRHVYAVDVRTGSTRWRWPAPDGIDDAIATDGRSVFVGGRSVRALDPATGDVKWRVGLRPRDGLTVGEGLVYCSVRGLNRAFALDADTGDEVWSSDVNLRGLVAVADGVVHGFSGGDLVGLSTQTGDEEWRTEFDTRSGGSAPTIRDDRILVGVDGVVGLDRETGDQLWHQPLGSATGIAATDDLVIVGARVSDNRDAAVIGVDIETGDERWRVPLGRRRLGAPVAAERTTLVPDDRGRLHAIDTDAGERLWTMTFPWRIGAPTMTDGAIVVNAFDGLYALDRTAAAETVQARWAGLVEPDPAPPGAAPAYPDAEFYFGTNGYDVETDVEVEVPADAPFTVDVTTVGDRIDDGQAVDLAFELENQGEVTLSLPWSQPVPFRTVEFEQVDGEESFVPWSPAYDETPGIHWDPFSGFWATLVSFCSQTLEPGESVDETYTISMDTHHLQPGTYEFTEGYPFEAEPEGDDRTWTVDLTIAIDIEATTPETGDVVHDLAITEMADLPEGWAEQVDIRVLKPITAGHPGLVEVSFADVDDGPGFLSRARRWPLGASVALGADGARLVLLPEELFTPDAIERRDDTDEWTSPILPHVDHPTGHLPSDVDSRRFIVFAHPDNDGPLAKQGYVVDQGYVDGDTEVDASVTLALH